MTHLQENLVIIAVTFAFIAPLAIPPPSGPTLGRYYRSLEGAKAAIRRRS